MTSIIEVKGTTSEDAAPLYVGHYHKNHGWQPFVVGILNGVMGGHHLTETGSKDVTTTDYSVHLTPNKNASTEFGIFGQLAAKRVAGQINRSNKGLHARVVPAPVAIIG